MAEARRNLTLTDRKLKTRGIASLAATIMRDQKAGDINKKDVQKRITAVLTEAYQKALDQLDGWRAPIAYFLLPQLCILHSAFCIPTIGASRGAPVCAATEASA